MKISFELPSEVRRHSILFVRLLVKCLRNDISELFRSPKVKMRASLMLASTWIDWEQRPAKVDIEMLEKCVRNSVQYRRHNNSFYIGFDANLLLPGTRTPIYRIIRFINYGNEDIKGCYLFSKLFLKYQKNIYKYWRAYFLRSQL